MSDDQESGHPASVRWEPGAPDQPGWQDPYGPNLQQQLVSQDEMAAWPPPDPAHFEPAGQWPDTGTQSHSSPAGWYAAGFDARDQTQPMAAGWPAQPTEQAAGATRPAGDGRGRIIALAVLAGLLAGLIAGYGGAWLRERVALSGLTTGALQELPQSPGEAPPLREGTVAAIANTALPTVVSISVGNAQGGEGTGSGFVLREDGYLITNNHVISDADEGRILVRFNDGTQARASVVGRSSSYDLGVLKVNREGLQPAPLGNSNAVRVGDPVIAIGSPLGLNGTVTTGIISAVNRPVTTGGQEEQSFISAIQTDAAINPGNSGGPLLDAEGRVIGINSAIATIASTTPFGRGEAGSIGLGFAIPINQAKRISEEIIASGRSRTPIIGVNLDTDYTGSGARIERVTPGGPAEGTGLKPRDVITEIDGRRVEDAMELIVAIRSHAPGDTVTLGLENGKEIKIELGVAPDE